MSFPDLFSSYSYTFRENSFLSLGWVFEDEHRALHRENGQMKFPVRENTGNLEVLPKHREFGLLQL